MPKGSGVSSVLKQVTKCFALTWIGSQVTKLPRAAAALLFAPLLKRVLKRVEGLLPTSVRNEASAFVVCVFACLSLAACVALAVVLAWA